ncbi:MAG: aminobutyraldehyde dehydrogenase [Thermodesulfobacteriota bacterium]|nr:MAG: aminobutyraldehyde dehydrogenase [Thermodesulfobacteriota bacterium]
MQLSCHTLIVGAGITGLTIARELLKKGVDDIAIVEKENSLGAHASGRNSGVLHAGIYYSPGTYKAKFCVAGNQLMKEYCWEKELILQETGKVIVTDDSRLDSLLELKKRADQSGAKSIIIDRKELLELEPYSIPSEKALYSPNTAVFDPNQILTSIKEELTCSGKVNFVFGTSFLGISGCNKALTNQGSITFNKFINAAGSFADKVAHSFGLGSQYKVLPFKGTYKKLVSNRNYLVRGNIYPVPDLRNPFLGVHFTRGYDGDVYIGPTAIPALGREEYGFFNDISLETLSILGRDAVLFFTNERFRAAAMSETKKYFAKYMLNEAKKLVPELEIEDIEDSPKVGIRPQLVDWKSKKLVMDFIILKDGDSLHILNAISPAFTCSMAFAEHVVNEFYS